MTPRRWLAFCNPLLRALITETLGNERWINDTDRLKVSKGLAGTVLPVDGPAACLCLPLYGCGLWLAPALSCLLCVLAVCVVLAGLPACVRAALPCRARDLPLLPQPLLLLPVTPSLVCQELRAKADNPAFQQRWQEVKQTAKAKSIALIERLTAVKLPNKEAMLDVQVKRIHEVGELRARWFPACGPWS